MRMILKINKINKINKIKAMSMQVAPYIQVNNVVEMS